jgi:nucleoside-diphosphate-sugar epimerase
MGAFAVTGTTSPLGARVVAALGQDDVVALSPDGAAARRDLGGTRCLVSLSVGPGPCPDPGGEAQRLGELRRALAAADEAGVPRVVHLSSAVVYGAGPENAVPLTEEAPLRPDPRFAWAVELAEAERLVAEWRDGGAGRTATVLRPAIVLAPDDEGRLARTLGGLSAPRTAGDRRPVQFVHVEDVAAAVVACATAGEPFDGPLNVAPDGWVGDDEAAALSGAALPPPAVPARLVPAVRRLLRLVRADATPPGAAAYASHPWVVASDRLRALGWAPAHTNEEAVVATTSCSPLASLPPRRRQELLLAVVGALVTGLLLTVGALVARRLRGTRP